MKKLKKRKRMLLILAGLLLTVWVFVAQFMMQDRISDNYAKKIFAGKNVELFTVTQKVRGCNLHYAKTGSDTLPTIIFIHGSPGSWSAFMHYLQDKELSSHYRLIAVDRPGFGYSDFGKPVHLAKQSELISALLPLWKNGKPVYLVGHSLGGPLIIKIAADNPSVFSGLVMLAGSVDPAMEDKEYWRLVITYSPLRWLVPSAMRYSNEELWYLKKDLVKLKNDFSKITCPVYILHGDKDDHVPVANVDYAKKMLINSSKVTTTILPNANHFIVWTKYDEIKDILMKLNR
jgi:pimeloyl-ACP methyl ester carboxylesterase